MTGITITNEDDRIFLHRMLDEARIGTVVEMRVDPASEPMRRRMWAMLNEVAKKVPHKDRFGNERYYDASQWKILLMFGVGQEVDFMPSLDGSTFLPYEGRSSKMNSRDMSELISYIDWFGTTNGVEFKDERS